MQQMGLIELEKLLLQRIPENLERLKEGTLSPVFIEEFFSQTKALWPDDWFSNQKKTRKNLKVLKQILNWSIQLKNNNHSFEKLFKNLGQVLALAKNKFDKERQNITQDVSLFLINQKTNWNIGLNCWRRSLQRWYKLLLLSQKDLVIMHTLHKAECFQHQIRGISRTPSLIPLLIKHCKHL